MNSSNAKQSRRRPANRRRPPGSQQSRNRFTVPIPVQPPGTNNSPVIRQTFGFKSTASTALPGDLITTAQLLNLLVMANTTSSVASLFQSVRLRKVTAWSSGALALQWSAPSGGNIGNKVTSRTDITQGETYVAKVRLIPPEGSAADSWQNYAIDTAASTVGADFYVAGGGASVTLHVKVDYQLAISNSPNGVTTTDSSVVVGTVYFSGLGPITDGFLYTPIMLRTYVPA